MERDPSIAARVLDVIAHAPDWINTSDIYAAVDEAENITIVSVSCRDLVAAGKAERRQISGRWCYRSLQMPLLQSRPSPAAELAHTLDHAPLEPTRHTAAGHALRAIASSIPLHLKLATLDRLAAIVADDISEVLRAIRADIEATN